MTMIAAKREYQTVKELIAERRLALDELVQATGVDRRVIDAIAHQRYTPSPEQRERVSSALKFPRSQIIWGHLNVAEEFAQARL
jgi:ribosome-binding protein aMBF1 (putative translation factor)